MTSEQEVQPHPEIAKLLGPQLTPDQARAIYQAGPEAVVFALLTLARIAANSCPVSSKPTLDPSCPSGQTPPYTKTNRKRRGKRPGAKPGHPGQRRALPEPNAFATHTLDACPNCLGPVTRLPTPRTRIIEDIPEHITPVVTRHTIHRYYCKTCRKAVEPTVTDALPGAQIGLRVVVLAAWLHYLLGTTLSQILDVFNFHLRFQLTQGGLVNAWHRLRELLLAWYREIEQAAKQSAVLHADETGWRVNGKTHWLWCFCSADTTYYHIDPGRGRVVVKKYFKKAYAGVLVTDFWGAYNAVACAGKQKCLPHLLRDLKRTTKYENPGGDWPSFVRRLRRLIRDSLRLYKCRGELSAEAFASGRDRLQKRLDAIIDGSWEQKHTRRLQKRLRRHRSELLTFLSVEGVPPDNNHGEREIRPAVLMRKNSQANGSREGALTQAVLMSIFRTLKRRGHDPIQTVVNAVREYLKSGVLPPFPDKKPSHG
jgi:transposase